MLAHVFCFGSISKDLNGLCEKDLHVDRHKGYFELLTEVLPHLQVESRKAAAA